MGRTKKSATDCNRLRNPKRKHIIQITEMKKVLGLITSFVLITFDLVLVFKGDFFIFLLLVLILGGIFFLHIVNFHNYLFYKHSFKNRFVCDFNK